MTWWPWRKPSPSPEPRFRPLNEALYWTRLRLVNGTTGPWVVAQLSHDLATNKSWWALMGPEDERLMYETVATVGPRLDPPMDNPQYELTPMDWHSLAYALDAWMKRNGQYLPDLVAKVRARTRP